MLDKLLNFFTGGIADTAMGIVEKYFPPDMTEEQKQNFRLEFEKVELQKNIEANKAIKDAEGAINKRIAEHEGTVKDLMALPLLGRIIIFARGCQRPLWGFGVMWGDVMWFSGDWGNLSTQQESALWLINLLVLGFLFGERALKNVAPLVQQILMKK